MSASLHEVSHPCTASGWARRPRAERLRHHPQLLREKLDSAARQAEHDAGSDLVRALMTALLEGDSASQAMGWILHHVDSRLLPKIVTQCVIQARGSLAGL